MAAERGPKGDHGQHGDTGRIGATGAAGERGPGLNLTTIVLVLVLPLVAYLYSVQLNQVENDRLSCQASNELREQFVFLGDDLVNVNEKRIAAPGSTPSEIKANQNAIDAYSARRQAVLDSVDPVDPDNPAFRDCEAAYPQPWPLG